MCSIFLIHLFRYSYIFMLLIFSLVSISFSFPSDSLLRCIFFFFFKQKTAYVMRISDWSSDVCSSDLQRFDFAELALDGAGADAGLLDLVAGLEQLLLHPVEYLAELAELGLDRAQGAPDFAGPLLDRQRAEAHLEAGHQRQQRGRTGHGDPAIALQPVNQAGPSQNHRVKAFGGPGTDREERTRT